MRKLTVGDFERFSVNDWGELCWDEEEIQMGNEPHPTIAAHVERIISLAIVGIVVTVMFWLTATH
jgi:hypothetical protein